MFAITIMAVFLDYELRERGVTIPPDDCEQILRSVIDKAVEVERHLAAKSPPADGAQPWTAYLEGAGDPPACHPFRCPPTSALE